MGEKSVCKKEAADYAYPFALWDMRLYLDTHPDDREALGAFRALCRKHPMGLCGWNPLRMDTEECDHWSWIDGPWPWEYEANQIRDAVCHSCGDRPGRGVPYDDSRSMRGECCPIDRRDSDDRRCPCDRHRMGGV